MTQNIKLLLEGSYSYFQNENNYSREDFKLIHFTDTHTYCFNSEITSRIETGEFLKVLVHYELNQHYAPTKVRIEKSIGNKYALEIYEIDTANLELFYTFKSSEMSQEFTRNISAKHYIATPAVCTCALFTLTKKFDATGKTPIVLISSNNDWTYEGPPTEKTIYAEYMTREIADFKINNSTLSASHLCLYETDTSHGPAEPVNLYLSKHYSVPYEFSHGDLKVVIKNLKKMD